MNWFSLDSGNLFDLYTSVCRAFFHLQYIYVMTNPHYDAPVSDVTLLINDKMRQPFFLDEFHFIYKIQNRIL